MGAPVTISGRAERAVESTDWRNRLLGRAACRVLRVFGASWHVTWEGIEHEQRLVEERTPLLYGFLHGRLLIASYLYRDYGAGIMVSRHRDGELAHSIGTAFGFRSFRGSTTRGGREALLEMCRVDPEIPLSLTTDGPRGPAGTVQPGIVMIAQKARRAVIPISFAARPAWRLRSWDRHVIPKPFARVHVTLGPPLRVPERLGRDAREQWIERIRGALIATDELAWATVEGRRAPELRYENPVLHAARSR